MNNWNLLFKETGGTGVDTIGKEMTIGEPIVKYKDPSRGNDKDTIMFFLEKATKDPQIDIIEEITGAVSEVIIDNRRIEEIFRILNAHTVSTVRINFHQKMVTVVGSQKK